MIRTAGFPHRQRVLLVGGHNGGTTAPENQQGATYELGLTHLKNGQGNTATDPAAALSVTHKAEAAKCGCVAG